MTHDGGSGGFGVIFSFDPSSSTYTNLKDFDSTNGKYSYGSLLQASDGKLYGMTAFGGSRNAGIIFSFDPFSSTFTKLKDFNIANGANPKGNLIQASNGKLYGMTDRGGSGGNGVIFSFDPFTFNYTKLRDFHDKISGLHPYGSLMQASNGKLYGMTTYGGSDGVGVIFSFDLSSSTYARLRNLNSTIGANPFGNLVQASDGKLYGMTSQGGGRGYGVIFSFNPSSFAYKRLKSFDNFRAIAYGSLIQATNGKLYGMTGGETSSFGSVIFSFDPFSSSYSRVIDFGTTNNGSQISGGLVHASDGKLYGVTLGGGSRNLGVIFSFDPSSFAYKSLKDFSFDDGIYSTGNLIQAHDGKLYGMTQYGGGINNYGVIFSFDPSSAIYTKLKNFDNTNGAYPVGSLIQASDGKLYGMTQYGGSSNAGVIFSFDPSSFTYTKLKDFDSINGGYPWGSLIQASDGKLYGTAGGGINYAGVIFSFEPSSSTYTRLKNFDITKGAYPIGGLIQASDGKLYGTTGGGGHNGHGVIFSFDPLSGTYKKPADFYGPNGYNSYGNLMQASDGKLYGMTTNGGSQDLGVIFSFDPISSILRKLKDFNGANGATPYYGGAFIELKDANIFPTVNISPADNTTYTAYPYAKIRLKAEASDADGIVSKVDFYNGDTLLHTEEVFPYGYVWGHVAVGNYILTAKATDNNGNVSTSDTVHISVVPDEAPTVNITSPANGASYTPYSNIILSVDANDVDGTIKKVDFYNGSTLIFTETVAPFKTGGYRLPLGNYSITAEATDNNGRVTTSLPVAISVVPDIAPTVSITSPANGTTYVGPATIILSADANDIDGTIKKVDFYNGSTLLFTENDAPYFRSWPDVPVGNYSITAKAMDNNGKITTSAPITISVISAKRSLAKEDKLNSSNEPPGLNLNPNPVANILNISVHGLQTNNRSTISVLSVSGAVIKTIQPGALNKNLQLDVSSLKGGVYFIKYINGDRVLYKQFVKL